MWWIRGYAPDLTDREVEVIGNDPFLVAYALVNTAGRSVVTKEISKPGKGPSKRRLPDMCNQSAISCIEDFDLYRLRNFSIR